MAAEKERVAFLETQTASAKASAALAAAKAQGAFFLENSKVIMEEAAARFEALKGDLSGAVRHVPDMNVLPCTSIQLPHEIIFLFER